MTEMKRSWLVQRLETPRSFNIGGKTIDNPFSFGGGLKNGGLSDEAMGHLRGIFSFDYMGAAEFEWGAVPKALQKIAKHALVGTRMEIEDSTVYILCDYRHEAEVRDRIRGWGTGTGERLKEPTRLDHGLRTPSYPVRGWLELDNGFFFFTDEQMWSSTAALFGVKTVTG